MTNITTRNDPFQELMREPFRELEPFFGWPRNLRRWFRDFPIPTEPQMKLDVVETDKAFTVKAELPGVKKEDISVEVDGDLVSITAEVRRETEKKEGETVIHSERYYGKQYRSFTLGREIDRKKVDATFADGVLTLTLPKDGGPAPERIPVK